MSICRRDFLKTTAATAGQILLGSQAMAAADARFCIIELAGGRLRGRQADDVMAFKGIRYAEPPTGSRRFLPPVAARSWSNIRDALNFGATCPQPGNKFVVPLSEDCLFLNVWAPLAGKKKPVMVWLHGGGFETGSGSSPTTDGTNLARFGDVVVVTVNHRLNLFGYLGLFGYGQDRFASSGNVGQLDIVAALQWVRDNIASFGGDPNNVTIFGESGGGCKVSVLMAMPDAAGLFHKAIVQSGSYLTFVEPDEARRAASRVFAGLGTKDGDLAALQQVPVQSLIDCRIDLMGKYPFLDRANLVRFEPVVDGKTLPSQSWASGAPAISANIPLMVGTTADEAAFFLEFFSGYLNQPIPTDEDLVRKLNESTMPWHPQFDAAAKVALYRRAYPQATRKDLLNRISTDCGMWKAAVQQAERKAAQGAAPVYAYEFAWKVPFRGGEYAIHGADVAFTFGNVNWPDDDDGRARAAQAAADPQGHRFELARTMMRSWSNFARTGDPSSEMVGPWRTYDASNRFTMVLDAKSELVNDLRGQVRD